MAEKSRESRDAECSPPIALRPARAARHRNGPDRGKLRPPQHGKEEWDKLYPIIKELYVTEHRKLNEVMKILEQKHGFRATEQMFKKRFKAWGLFKNKRRKAEVDGLAEGASASAGISQPRGPARPGTITSSFEDNNPLMQKSGGPTWQSYQNMRLFGRHEGEDAFACIANWVNANFDRPQGYWANMRSNGAPSDSPRIYPSSSMYHDFALASALWMRAEGRLAGLAVRKAFLRLEDVFLAGDPGIVRNLLDVFVDMMRLRQTQLIKILRCYLASIATRELHASHPLARLFQYLARDDVDLAFMFKQIWRYFVSNFHKRMGKQQLWLYEQWAWDSSFQVIDTDPEADRDRVREALQTLALNTQFIEATKSSRSHMELLKSTGLLNNKAAFVLPKPRGGYAQSYAMRSVVWDAIDRRDWDTVEQSMLSEIQTLTDRHGSTSPRVIRELWSLEKVMRKAGRFERADAIGQDVVQRIKAYLSDVPDVV